MYQPAVEHRLDGKLIAYREVSAPHSAYLMNTDFVVQSEEVVSIICISCLKLTSFSGEIPIVFAVIVGIGEITDKVVMIWQDYEIVGV